MIIHRPTLNVPQGQSPQLPHNEKVAGGIPTIIYALCHPITSEIRYIGKSIRLKARYNRHCRATTKTHCSSWVQSLRPNKPILVELEMVGSGWVEAEQFWISYFKSMGANLVNHTLGGEGVLGNIPTDETCKKLSSSLVGKKLSDEHKAKISARMVGNKIGLGNQNCKLNIGKSLSEEIRQKISDKMTGNKNGVGNKNGLGNIGNKHSEETKLKISVALKIRAINKGSL